MAENKKTQNHKRMGNQREIWISAGAVGVLFLCLFLYLGHFVATSEQDMINNSYNSRQQILLSRNYRGSIYSRDGEVLAETILNDEEEESRNYPYKNLFSHIVGYSTQGRMGVEALANYYLINTNTSLSNKVKNDTAGKKNPGDNVYTTLDVKIQQVANDQLDIYRGAIIVTEVSTGKILAMVSHPDFDPNSIGEIWEDLVDNDSSTVLVNRATQGLYPPGSTFKIITALAYIRQNQNDYYNYSYNCDGQAYISGGTTIACFDHTVHGYQDLRKAFANSCNSAFSTIGAGLNKTSFINLCNTFLFNSNLPVGFEYSKSTMSVTKDSSVSEMQETGIGQGKTMMSPLHNLMIAASVANDGVMMTPYMVDNISDSEGRVVVKNQPSAIDTVMSAEEAEYLTECMRAVVTSGTGYAMKNSSYEAAGKTGSAQYDDSEKYHSWFTGFAPYDNPQIAVCVILEGGYSGVSSAQYVAKAVFDTYFGY